jgi:hypothetical protein
VFIPGPLDIGRAVNRAATALHERRRDLNVSLFIAHTVPLESEAISAPIDLLAIRADSPRAANTACRFAPGRFESSPRPIVSEADNQHSGTELRMAGLTWSNIKTQALT